MRIWSRGANCFSDSLWVLYSNSFKRGVCVVWCHVLGSVDFGELVGTGDGGVSGAHSVLRFVNSIFGLLLMSCYAYARGIHVVVSGFSSRD